MDPYVALGIEPGATNAEIKHVYRRLAKRYHPDRSGGGAECVRKFREVQNAYELLADPLRRRSYEQQRSRFATAERPGTGTATGDDPLNPYGPYSASAAHYARDAKVPVFWIYFVVLLLVTAGLIGHAIDESLGLVLVGLLFWPPGWVVAGAVALVAMILAAVTDFLFDRLARVTLAGASSEEGHIVSR